MAPILGCIADDFTGATDLANMLARGGMRTIQLFGVPDAEDVAADAVVVALKSRSIPAADAVARSLSALAWLRAAGCRQYFFKYCSTFDSTDAGNIGPVTDALLDALEEDFTIVCPAFPETGRTVYKGHLFVGDQLLSDSPMRHHPVTPMTDSNLVAMLERQSHRSVGLVQHVEIESGPDAVRAAFEALKAEGHGAAVVDAIDDRQLLVIGKAVSGLKLVTGGSGIALGLPQNYRDAGLLAGDADTVPPVPGRALVLSGSCSPATLRQVAEFSRLRPSLRLDPLQLASGPQALEDAIDWACESIGSGPVMVYASAVADDVRAVQTALGRGESGALIESAMAAIACRLVGHGVRRLVVAGGETSGAVVGALGVRGIRIGAQIDPGVPGTVTLGEPQLALALKSGNFGAPDFFEKALRMMP